MKIQIVILVIFGVMSLCTADQEFILGEEGGRYLKLIYLKPQKGESLRVAFRLKINDPLPQGYTAAAI